MSETWIGWGVDYGGGEGEGTWIDRLPSHGLTLYHNDIASKNINASTPQLIPKEEAYAEVETL